MISFTCSKNTGGCFTKDSIPEGLKMPSRMPTHLSGAFKRRRALIPPTPSCELPSWALSSGNKHPNFFLPSSTPQPSIYRGLRRHFVHKSHGPLRSSRHSPWPQELFRWKMTDPIFLLMKKSRSFKSPRKIRQEERQKQQRNPQGRAWRGKGKKLTGRSGRTNIIMVELYHYVLGSALFTSYALVNVYEEMNNGKHMDHVALIRHFLLYEKISVLVRR